MCKCLNDVKLVIIWRLLVSECKIIWTTNETPELNSELSKCENDIAMSEVAIYLGRAVMVLNWDSYDPGHTINGVVLPINLGNSHNARLYQNNNGHYIGPHTYLDGNKKSLYGTNQFQLIMRAIHII